MVVIRTHVQQHHSKRDVAGLDVVVLRPSVHKRWRALPVDGMPYRLRQEHATHVSTPSRIVVPIELIDEDVGGCVAGRGHYAWAHSLLR